MESKTNLYDMSKRQDLVKEWIKLAKESKISQAFIANRVGLTAQNLNYHLNESPELDLDIYNKIKLELNKLIDLPGVELEILEHREKKQFTVSYPILGQIPAGLAEIKEHNDWPEYSDLNYDPRKHFWLQIDDEYGFSMNPFLKSGDLILCSVQPFKLRDGDLVAVRWDKTKGALKLYKEKNVGNEKLIILASYNASESPIILKQSEVEQIYKVVNIKKK
jgi:SOS-response transcriptional repressor LexA